MKTTKPDRFERAVKKARLFSPADVGIAITLLRREHRAVVRMVLREFKVWATTSPNGYASAPASRHERVRQCGDILDKLRRRAI